MHRNMCIQYKVLQDIIIIVIRGNTVYYGIFFWHQTPSEIQLTSLRGKCWQEPNPEQSSPLPSAKFAILAQSSFQTRAPNSDTAVGPVPLSHLQQVAMVFSNRKRHLKHAASGVDSVHHVHICPGVQSEARMQVIQVPDQRVWELLTCIQFLIPKWTAQSSQRPSGWIKT